MRSESGLRGQRLRLPLQRLPRRNEVSHAALVAGKVITPERTHKRILRPVAAARPVQIASLAPTGNRSEAARPAMMCGRRGGLLASRSFHRHSDLKESARAPLEAGRESGALTQAF
jgi:hypothetical protein